MVRTNRKYKDSLFCYLFGHPEMKHNLLELTNALTGCHYTNVDDLEINTLQDFIYINIKNDVSCILHDQMFLYEHQSTQNPNMPVREMIYCSQLFQKYLEGKNYYSSRLIQIPTPLCFVLCNSSDMQEDRKTLRLSDAFMNKHCNSGCEWTVTVVNINYGRNPGIMNACKALDDYSYLVHLVGEFKEQGYGLKESIDLAVNICIQKDVLKEFLSKHKAEVSESMFTEYDEVESRKMLQEESFEDGFNEGLAKGFNEGQEKGQIQGRLSALRDLIKKAMSKQHISFEQACDFFDVSPNDRQALTKI